MSSIQHSLTNIMDIINQVIPNNFFLAFSNVENLC